MSGAAGIVLAAGPSHRLGRPKPLLTWRGKTFLRNVAEALAPLVEPLIVVLPPHAPEIARELDGLGARRVFQRAPERGMGASLALAARALLDYRDPFEQVLVALVDQPLVDRALFERLLAAARAGEGWAAADYGGGDWGPPVCLPAAALPAVAELDGERGARGLLEAERERLAWVPFPDGRFDIDTPADYDRLLAQLGS